MRRSPEMASPRTIQASAPNTARTYGSTARSRTVISSNTRYDATTSSSRGPITSSSRNQASKQATVRASTSKTEQGTTTEPTDPYSLSDLEDDTSVTARGQQVRKRKRSAVNQNGHGSARGAEKQVPAKLGSKPRKQFSKPASTEVLWKQNSKSGTVPLPEMARAPTSNPPEQRTGDLSEEPILKGVTPPRKQRRLIDALAAQKDSESESDNEIEDRKAKRELNSSSQHLEDEIRSLVPPSPSVPVEGRSPAKVYTPRTMDASGKGTKIKFTYSQTSRSMAPAPRGLSQVGVTLPEEPESDSIVSSPLNTAPDPFDLSEASDLEDDKRLEIKSVHELRRAGANNRFSDELEDLISRIGNAGPGPSTLRRNALLELSQKLQKKDFASQFRDHADRDSIAHHVGDEADLISGFALSSVLVIFLSDRPAPHLLCKLASDGIGKLLGRLLLVQDDIDAIASRKETNLSKHSRRCFSEVKSYILQMDLWAGHSVTDLTPRTLALQLLDLLYKSCNWDEARTISADCLGNLSLMAADLIEELEGSLDSDINFSLLVSIMESQSNVARAADQEVVWLRQQSSNATDILRRTLQAWHNLPARTRMAALKMAINATNTSEGASAFGNGKLLGFASQCISDGIVSAREAVDNHRLDDVSYQSLLLVLGVMINILEHCPAARGLLKTASISRLADLYAANRLAMSEADSEEKSKLSVAFGYLAVSLGYLSLSEPGLTVVRSLQSGQGVRRLLGSIRDFIDVYRNVDSKIHGLEGLVSELQTQLL